MSILTKILLGLVFIAILPVLYLSAAVLNLQNEWHKVVAQRQAAIAKLRPEIDRLQHGDRNAPLSKVGTEKGPTRQELEEVVKLWDGVPSTYGVDQLQILAVNASNDSPRTWVAKLESVSEELKQPPLLSAAPAGGAQPVAAPAVAGLPQPSAGSVDPTTPIQIQTLNVKIYAPHSRDDIETILKRKLENTEWATAQKTGTVGSTTYLMRNHLIPDRKVGDPIRDYLTLLTPDPRTTLKKLHGLKKSTVVYVFEPGSAAAKGRFIGEFRVDELQPDPPTDELVLLHPTRVLTPEEFGALTGNPMLVLFDRMPLDQRDVYSSLDAKAIHNRVPPEVVAEYLLDGEVFDKDSFESVYRERVLKTQPSGYTQPAAGTQEATDEKTKIDAEFAKFAPHLVALKKKKSVDAKGEIVWEDDTDDKGRVKTKYMRPLRDYALLFDNYSARIADMTNRIEDLTADIEYSKRAQANSEAVLAVLDTQGKSLADEQKILADELKVVADNNANLDALLTKLREDVSRAVAESKRLAEEIAAGGGKTAGVASPDDSALVVPAGAAR